MSAPAAHGFCSIVGVSGADLRIEISGNGRKNLLAIVAGYSNAGFAAHNEPTFYGRLSVIQGTVPNAPDIDAASVLQGVVPKVLFDIILHDLGPHTFFFPLAQLDGNTQTDEGGTLTIILAAAQDSGGKHFVPRINCSGQTVFGKSTASIVGAS